MEICGGSFTVGIVGGLRVEAVLWIMWFGGVKGYWVWRSARPNHEKVHDHHLHSSFHSFFNLLLICSQSAN